MQYDEQYFKKSANRKAMIIWLILGIVLSGAYAVEIIKGLRTIEYYIEFLSLCWIPFFIGLLILKIKGTDTNIYKAVIAIGYGVFYVFVLLTTTSALAFVYLLPLVSMLILYKNRNFLIICGVANLLALGVSIGVNMQRGFNAPSDITQYEIQIACTILCYAGYILSINHMQSSDGALMSSLKGNLDKVVNTVETVKMASNEIVDGMSAVRELADENILGANSVVGGMTTLTNNNTALQQSTKSSLDLTGIINTQVQNVAAMIRQMVELAAESVNRAQSSSEELSEVVRLSTEVEEVLRAFGSQFKTMSDEINMIENITLQTNILSLNASVEAARAGAAGKGFAVVAGEIRNLSSKTKASSDSIFAALQHLESTSQKMTDSITKTLAMVKQVTQSVTQITKDTTQMGDGIHTIDAAVSEVSASNTKLVDNMNTVSDVVTRMTESIVSSEETTKAMLEKNIETTKNVADVETTVGKLMEELGVIGVMGIRDIKEGQYAVLDMDGQDIKVQISEILAEGVAVTPLQSWNAPPSAVCSFIVTIDNSYYKWENAALSTTTRQGLQRSEIKLTTPPSVVNRRRYKRVPLTNPAYITLEDTGYTCRGQMINLSEGGYAFKSNDPQLLGMIHQTVSLEIGNFPAFRPHELDAKVIRAGEERGYYSIGCRFLYDNMEIRSYLGS